MTIYIAFDAETTGLEPGSRMLELAAVAFNGEGEVLAEFSELISPGMPIPLDVQAIHGITEADIAGRMGTREACIAFLNWIEDVNPDCGVAHFAPYDVGIISYALGQSGLELPGLPVIDTCAMAKALKETPNNKLVTVAEHYAIPLGASAHRALSDATACMQYFCKVKDRAPVIDAPWATTYSHIPEPSTLAGIEAAIASGSAFSFSYQDQAGAVTDRTITPYGFAYNKKAMVEFHGLCHLRNERRTFLAHRIQSPATP